MLKGISLHPNIDDNALVSLFYRMPCKQFWLILSSTDEKIHNFYQNVLRQMAQNSVTHKENWWNIFSVE